LHPPVLQSGVGLSANAEVAMNESASIARNTIFFIGFVLFLKSSSQLTTVIN
jgi:hypothetical protein